MMIRISDKGIAYKGGQELFADSVVFLADEPLVRKLESSDLVDRIEAAIGGGRAIIWVAAGSPPQLTVIACDEAGRVLQSVTLPTGLTITAGSLVEVNGSQLATIRVADTQTEWRLALEGSDAGVLISSAMAPRDAWIRYFYFAHGPSPIENINATPELDGFRFQIFDPASLGGPVSVRFDPSRPFDRARSQVTPVGDTPRKTNFRTPWGGVVTLAAKPNLSNYVWAFDPVRKEAYLTLDGYWEWAVSEQGETEDDVELLLGYSGSEYVKAPASWLVCFVAGAPAFAHGFRPETMFGADNPNDAFPLSSQIPGVFEPVTTAWFYVKQTPDEFASSLPGGSDAHAGYYSQPHRAPLFTPDGNLLRALTLEAAQLPPDAKPQHGAPSAGFPVAPYAGIEIPQSADADAWLDRVRQFETKVLAAARTTVIYGLAADGPRGLDVWAMPRMFSPTGAPTGPSGPVETAVTPQGLFSVFSPDHTDWRQLVLAQTGRGQEQLRYTAIQGKLREALLANQIFLVVSDIKKLYECCSTAYCVTDYVIQLLKEKNAPQAVLNAAVEIRGRTYETLDYFDNALKAVLGQDYGAWNGFFLEHAELAQLTIAGWTFDLASRQWADSTILIIKFADGDIDSLVNDLAQWTMPGQFNQDGAAVQKRLQDIVKDAKQRLANEPELQYFVETVLADRQSAGRDVWNGVLYLNVAVPTNAFPPDIAALAAGLPPGGLRAHHLCVTLSSFDLVDGAVNMDDSSLFGLILYEDPVDLVYQSNPYDFKILSLRIRFANSAIASFTSQIELLAAQIFNETAALQNSLHGNNILLDGSLQKGSYRFATSKQGSYDFKMFSQVLDAITVTSAQFISLPDQGTDGRKAASFVLNGSMTFRQLGDFDLFGFGPKSSGNPQEGGLLVFSNLIVSMDFDPNNPNASRTFGFVAGQMNLDPSSSQARAGSLPRRFPLRISAMRQSEQRTDSGKTKTTVPADLGFIPVESPLAPGVLGPVWFGLEMSLSFGSPGALAPKLGFTGALLAAWAPGTDQYNVAIGVRLPGSEGGKKSLTVMGPLKLGIGRLNFLYDDQTKGYLLRLQNVALSFLGLSFPPGGKTNALLFGDPDPKASNNALGWYLAYKKDSKKKEDNQPPKLESSHGDTHPKLPHADTDKGGCDTCPQ